MKKLERRIRSLVTNRPGIRTTQIAEYLGLDPRKVRRTLAEMKEKGAIVGKPLR